MRVSVIASLAILLVFHVSFAQGIPSSNTQSSGASVMTPQLQKVLEQILRWQISFGSNSVSTGAKIQLQELNRQRLGDRTFVKYRPVISGVPAKGPYALMRWGLDDSLHSVIKGFSLRGDGTLICPGTTGAVCDLANPDEPFELNFFGAQGEELRLSLTTIDGNPLATMSTTPFPLQSKEKGCKLSAVLLMPNAVAIYIEGEGFTPNATVSFATNSSGEKKELVHQADAHGNLLFVILPSTIGRDSGTITIRPDAGPCHPQVTVPWGKHSYQLE
jgi:hypothetical protein